MMNATAIEQQALQVNRTATLNRSQTSGPADTFQTKDGWILIQTVGGPLFKRWAELMGEDHWLEDPRFKDDISRGDNGEIISNRLAQWCAERTNEQVLREMETRWLTRPGRARCGALQLPRALQLPPLPQIPAPARRR